jgi:hypothetical protein
MKLSLTNNTDSTLTGLRVQNCVFLKGFKGFQTIQKPPEFDGEGPYNARATTDNTHWVITAWFPGGLTWGNSKNPCFHSDPTFKDCSPGQTSVVYGWLSFYQGSDVEGEFKRIENTGWLEDRWEDRPGWNNESADYL